jgi:hypothetical protein
LFCAGGIGFASGDIAAFGEVTFLCAAKNNRKNRFCGFLLGLGDSNTFVERGKGQRCLILQLKKFESLRHDGVLSPRHV